MMMLHVAQGKHDAAKYKKCTIRRHAHLATWEEKMSLTRCYCSSHRHEAQQAMTLKPPAASSGPLYWSALSVPLQPTAVSPLPPPPLTTPAAFLRVVFSLAALIYKVCRLCEWVVNERRWLNHRGFWTKISRCCCCCCFVVVVVVVVVVSVGYGWLLILWFHTNKSGTTTYLRSTNYWFSRKTLFRSVYLPHYKPRHDIPPFRPDMTYAVDWAFRPIIYLYHPFLGNKLFVFIITPLTFAFRDESQIK